MIDVNVQNPGFYYAVFLFLSLVSASTIQFYEGKRRNFPVISWILVILVGKILFLSCTQLITYNLTDWKYIIHTLSFPTFNSRSILGGAIGFAMVYLIVRYFLKYNNYFLDALTMPLLVAMTIQRLGCFFVGCCSGSLTDLPWGISYGQSSIVYTEQINHGLLHSGAVHSLLVHPTALYQIIACLSILWLHYFLRNKWKAPGSSLIFVIIAYLISRFVIEFFVNPSFNSFGSNIILHIKLVQWFSFILAIILIFTLHFNETRVKIYLPTIPENNTIKNLALTSVLFLLIVVGKDWFSPVELVVFGIILIVLFSVLLFKFYFRNTIRNYRWVPVVMFSLVLILTSQSYKKNKDTTWTSYTTFGLGHLEGFYQTKYSTGCGSVKLDHETKLNSFSYAIQQTKNTTEYKNRELGLVFISGWDKYRKLQSSNSYNEETGKTNIFLINPYCSYYNNNFGFSTGFALGNTVYGTKGTEIFWLPELNFSAGSRKILYAEIGIFNSPFVGSHVQQLSMSLGSGLGLTNGTKLNLGVSNNGNSAIFNIMASGSFVIKKYLVLSPAYSYYDQNNHIFSINLQYRILDKKLFNK
jgi:prolipoprotein diacylglyceryltransferase